MGYTFIFFYFTQSAFLPRSVKQNSEQDDYLNFCLFLNNIPATFMNQVLSPHLHQRISFHSHRTGRIQRLF